MMCGLALRLDSFRDLLESDLTGTLGRISDAGFRAVEVTQLLGDSNEHFAKALETAGLEPVSMHVHLHELRASFKHDFQGHDWLPVTYLVIPIVQLDEYGSGWERLGNELGSLATATSALGLQLVYQPNHAEFRPDRDRTGMDFLVEAAGEALQYELDLKILSDSRADPESVLSLVGARAPLIVLDFEHLEPTEDHPVLQAWREYQAWKDRGGLEWIVVSEQPGTGERFEKLALIHSVLSADQVAAL